MAVDLGTNLGLSLPLSQMRRLEDFDQAEPSRGLMQTAAGVSTVTSYKLPDSWIDAQGIINRCTISGSERQTDAVLGLGYFRQFSYVIIDYPARRMYIGPKPVQRNLPGVIRQLIDHRSLL